MKADRYLFDGSHPCALRKLPCDSNDDHVKKEDILAKTAENLEKMAALQDAFYADGREGLVIILQALDAAGKDSTGMGFFTGAAMVSATHCFMSRFIQPLLSALAGQDLGRAHRGGGRVLGVVVRADAVAELLGHRRAAHHDLHLFTDARLFSGFYHILHNAHGSRQQSRATDYGAVLLLSSFYKGVRRHVSAQIHHLEALALHHHLHQIFPNVVHAMRKCCWF